MRQALAGKTDFESFARSIFFFIAARRCFFSALLLQDYLQKLYTPPKYFQKLIFSLKTLEIGKCVQR